MTATDARRHRRQARRRHAARSRRLPRAVGDHRSRAARDARLRRPPPPHGRRGHLRPRRRAQGRRPAARRVAGDGGRDPARRRAADRGGRDRQGLGRGRARQRHPGDGVGARRSGRAGQGSRRARRRWRAACARPASPASPTSALDLVEDPAVQWVVDAGLGVPVVGVHDAPANPVVFLRRVASLQKATKAFRAVAPLPRRVSTEAPSTGYDDVKLIALAALLVDGVGRVQVDWRQHGRQAQRRWRCCSAPTISTACRPTDDAPLGPRRAPLEEVRRNILAASLTPVARTARFEAVARRRARRGAGARGSRRVPAGSPIVRLGAVSYLNTRPLVDGPRRAARRRAALRRAGALRRSRRGRRGRSRAGADHRVRAPRRRLRGRARTCRSRRSPPSIRWRCSRASRSSASGRSRSTSARARRPAWSGCCARGTSASARRSCRRRRTSARCSPRPTRRC